MPQILTRGLGGPFLLTSGIGNPSAPTPGSGSLILTRGLGGPFLLTRGLGVPVPIVVPYDLHDAIVAQLRASLDGVPIHGSYAGPDGVMPYVDLYVITAGRTYNAGGDYIVDGQVQANAFADTRLLAAQTADRASDELAAAARAGLITFQRGRLMSLRAMDGSFSREAEPGVDGCSVWQEVRLLRFRYSSS